MRLLPPTCSATACSRSVHINLHISRCDRCELSPDVLRVWTQEWFFRLLSQTNCDPAPWCRSSRPPGRHKGRLSAGRSAVTPTIFRRGETIFSSTTAVSLTTRRELSATCSPYCDLTSFFHLKREFPEIFTTCRPNIWKIWPQSPSCRLAGAKFCNSNQSLHHWSQSEGSGRYFLNCKAWYGRSDTGNSVAETASSSCSDSHVARMHWKQHLASSATLKDKKPGGRKASGILQLF